MKKLIALTVLVLTGVMAYGDLMLNWTVAEADTSGITYQYAFLRDGWDSDPIGDGVAAGSKSEVISDLGVDTAGKSFFIELTKFENNTYTTVGMSEILSASALADFTSVNAAGLRPVWNGGSFHAVPEPTSGLLMLLGLAGLALKRKRA